MKKLTSTVLLALLFSLSSVSCSRIEDRELPKRGNLKDSKLETVDSIPREYGNFVNVTANPKYHNWAQLWFEDSEGTIRIVSVGIVERRLGEYVITIPRK